MHEYVVTFTDASYVGVTEEPTNLQVTVVANVEPVDVADDADVADTLVQLAVASWILDGTLPPVDWTLDEPGWEAVLIHLPDGDVLDLG